MSLVDGRCSGSRNVTRRPANDAGAMERNAMPDHREIYQSRAGAYDRLVAREDYEDNVPRALAEIWPLAGRTVVELGAGTGRLTRILAPLAHRIWLYDASAPMLSVAVKHLEALGTGNWGAAVADHRHLPLPAGLADVAISGWSVCYLNDWSRSRWWEEVARGLREMERVLRKDGTIVLIETLGTGRTTPQAPGRLGEYYAYLEQEEGFNRTWIRTDYEFASLEEARELAGFFFGEELAAKVEEEKWIKLPECTGLWWRRR